MTAPKLARASSGFGGRGYKHPFTGELVPSVTTALGALDKGGVTQWAVDNTAAFAVANIDALLNRTEEAGYGFLRWYWKRMKPDAYDNPEIDIRDYSNGVLDDLSDLGTLIHEYIQADLEGWLEPDLFRDEHYQMVEAYLAWKTEHDIEVHATEATLWGEGVAGTADLFAKIDGVNLLVDIKTSRRIVPSHLAQLAALGSAYEWLHEVPEGTPDSAKYVSPSKKEVSWWVRRELPPVQGYAILRVRPDDWDEAGNQIPAFCRLEIIPQEQIDAAHDIFLGALKARHGEARLKKAMKEKEKSHDA